MSLSKSSAVVLSGPHGEALIRKTPGVSGGDACLRSTRIPVWLLAEYRRLGMADDKILESYPGVLDQADLDAAWAYQAAHPREIEQALWHNWASDVDRGAAPLPVWLVILGQRLGLSNEEVCNGFLPPLSPAELDSATDYYRRHPEEVEQAIRRNPAA